MSAFKIGDMVTWTSQSGGYTTEKTGVIVGVVPPHHRLSLHNYAGFKEDQNGFYRKYNTGPIDSCGLSRDHESYLVAVKTGKTDKAKKTIYWPIVSLLKRINGEP